MGIGEFKNALDADPTACLALLFPPMTGIDFRNLLAPFFPPIAVPAPYPAFAAKPVAAWDPLTIPLPAAATPPRPKMAPAALSPTQTYSSILSSLSL